MAAPVYALVLGFCAWHLAGALEGQVRDAYARVFCSRARAQGEGEGRAPKGAGAVTATAGARESERGGELDGTPGAKPTTANTNTNADPFLSRALTPHALHALFLTLTILLTGHVQIMLRQAASLPVVYWAAAWLFMGGADADADADADANADGKKEKKKRQTGARAAWGRAWVGWSVVWGAVSLVLWVAFLPPA
ncbi:glycosyltransferase family 76 protein [Athelia psychrophila]|nr:glycosyltransferase family 76 protein [Fibularhizoctonia sp. CBS 109695]